MRNITAVHMVGGTQHEHIGSVKYNEGAVAGQATREQMVAYINGGGTAYVTGGGTTAYVGVVKVNPPYIRTHADGKWTDNLLSLPRY